MYGRASWWDEPGMARALAHHDITTVYRLLNTTHGVPQRKIAQLTGHKQSDVSEILNGRVVSGYDVLVRICDGFGIPRGWMGLARCKGDVSPYPDGDPENGGIDPAEVDVDMVSRRILGLASAALLGAVVADGLVMQSGVMILGEQGGLKLLEGHPGTLAASDIAWIRAAHKRLQEHEHLHGGASVYGAARGITEQTVGALRGSEANRDLYVAVSRLCSLAGWCALDAGRSREFWQCQATALELAKLSGDLETSLILVNGAGRAEILAGNHIAAAKLFDLLAVHREPDAVDWGLVGSAYAPNSPDSARSALDHLRYAEGADSPDAVSMFGNVSMDLGDYDNAIAAFTKVLPQRKGRVEVQETTALAMAHLKGGDTDVGVRYAQKALLLADDVRSTQCTDALRRLSPVLAKQKDSTAKDLARQFATA